MERDFQTSHVQFPDDAVFTGGSFQSLISLPSYFPVANSTMDLPAIQKPTFQSSFSFFGEDLLPRKSNPQLGEKPANYDSTPFTFPKTEPLHYEEFPSEPTQPFDFFSNHLPDLHSLERYQLNESSSHKRARFGSVAPAHSDYNDPQSLDSIVPCFTFTNTFFAPPKTSPSSDPPHPKVIPHSELARQRRQKISEKIRCLQKLMPWDKKMDTATMLEEARKYVKFLQAQISVLQPMHLESSFNPQSQNNGNALPGLGSLGRLNRQQLLQVLLNSPVAQTILYSQGCCVFSMEQLVFLKKVAGRKAITQQNEEMAFDSSGSC